MLLDLIYKVIRTSAILTGSYVAATVLDTRQKNQLVLYVNFTKGSLDSGQVKIEFSKDGITWFQETYDAISAGTNTETLGARTMVADGLYRFFIPIMEPYVRVSAKGTGTATSSLMDITAGVGVI